MEKNMWLFHQLPGILDGLREEEEGEGEVYLMFLKRTARVRTVTLTPVLSMEEVVWLPAMVDNS
jgi:phage terminase large subunit-like protein